VPGIRRTLRRVLIGLPLVVLVAAVAVIGASYLEHRRLSGVEQAAYPPPGVLVPVHGPHEDAAPGTRLHVYAEGEGAPTLVFLSGLGTSAPVFDFKPLFTRLSDSYRIAVVERAGYGWSDIGDRPRDIDTVLEETRLALREAGEPPPYVLFPHSLAGLEAIRWAQRHPDEVAVIIGLDPLVPGYHEATGEDASLSPWITFLARTGLMRNGPQVFARNFPAMVEGRLTTEEAAAARAIFMRRTNTPDMWAEARAMPANSAVVRDAAPPPVPVFALVSHAQPAAWQAAITACAQATGGAVRMLDAGHYLHVEEPERVARISRTWIDAAMEG
jgi:pimeloyl-ACP methyl ester carboxylesterase